MNKTQAGAYGEQRALAYLQKKGYGLLARNYRYGHKEIDIIMQDGECIVFVEVKSRRGDRFGAAREAVDARKQQNLITAARRYLQAGRLETPARFDVVEYDFATGKITHLIDAFRA